MSYSLEKIDDQAADYLLRAVEKSSQLNRDFFDARRWNGLPVGWARDPVSDSFLVAVPTFIRDESGDRQYCFYYQGAPCRVTLLGFMGWDAQLTEVLSSNEASTAAFYAALKDAFAVHKECVSMRDGHLVALGEAVIPQFKG